MLAYQKEFIELSLKYKALCFGDFTLKSGRQSPYFFNMGQLCTGNALKELGKSYANAITQANLTFDSLFGPAYKGIPLVSATAIALAEQFDQDIPYSFDRKEAKTHGEQGIIVGAKITDKVLIIDDVITSGSAKLYSNEVIQAQGGKVAGIVIAVDRQEKGQGNCSAVKEISTKLGVPIVSIISFADILDYVKISPEYSIYQQKLLDYRSTYGIQD